MSIALGSIPSRVVGKVAEDKVLVDVLIEGDGGLTGFRPVHYLGNKSRVLDEIVAVVDEVAPPQAMACDLFAGSGVVSRRLAMQRPVLASDIQEYSRVLVSALTHAQPLDAFTQKELLRLARSRFINTMDAISNLIELESNALTDAVSAPDVLADIIEHRPLAAQGDLAPGAVGSAMASVAATLRFERSHTILRHYGGVYFSYRQAAAIDALSNAIAKLPSVSRDTALAALLSTASEIASTIGNHFAQPIRPRDANGQLKKGWVNTIRARRQVDVFSRYIFWLARYHSLSSAPFECFAIAEDYRETLSRLGPEVGVVYADPPYTRDHYSRFYHVLETLALGDEPGITTQVVKGVDQPSRGLYRMQRHQSPFSIRTRAAAAFEDLFVGVKRIGVPLILSYSPCTFGTVARPQPRLLTIPQLTLLARQFFSSVEVISAGQVAHSKFNNERLNGEIDYTAEILLIGKP
jgi:adenine-specific DNA methylase